MKQWRCTVCGYIHEGEEPPAKCPICGAPTEKFELMEEMPGKQGRAKEQKQPVQTQYDVIVVGSGASALTAAITACHGGAKVLLLEKAAELGGTSKRSGGGMWVPLNKHQKKHGIEDNAKHALQYMARCSYPNLYDESSDTLGLPKDKYDLLAAYVSNASPMIDFLQEIGALKTITGISWKQKPQVDYAVGLSQNREIRGRTLFPMTDEGKEGLGPDLMGQLIAWAEKSSIDILTGCRVTDILRDNAGRAVAVKALYHEKPTEFYAEKGIIFGSGGYSHNKEMMLHYQRGPHYGGCSVPENTGDLIAMAGKAGVQLGNMAGAFRAQSMFELALSTPGGSHNVFYIPGDSVLEVDKYGNRVLDEKQNYTDRAMLHFVWDPEKMEWKNMLLFMIFDKRTASLWAGFPPYPVPGQKASYIIEADSLDGIAAQIAERLKKHAKDTGGFRLDETFQQNLKKSVARFNHFAANGFDEDFHRGETPYDTEWTTFPPTMPDGQWPTAESRNISMYPLSAEGPYYAIILGAGTLDTNGGPVVNNHAQMLDWDNAPVPGLYGAGNCIAAPSANAYWGAGGTLGPGMTFGYIAAMHALKG